MSTERYPISFDLYDGCILLSRHSVRSKGEMWAVVEVAKRIYPLAESRNVVDHDAAQE